MLPVQTISVGAGGCVCFTEPDHYESHLDAAYVTRARAQYDRRVAGGLYVGVTAAGELVARYRTRPGVALLGPVVVLRSTGTVSASLRIAAGGAYSYDSRWVTSPEPRNRHTFGWFLDMSVEIATTVSKDLDLFVDLSLLSYRNLKYRHAHPPGVPSWGYFTAGLPTMLTVGLRYGF